MSTPDGSTPKQIILQVGNFESPRTGFAVQDVVPDPVERILAYQPSDPPSKTWLITEANAGEFGLDWNAFEGAMLGQVSRRQLYVNLGNEKRGSEGHYSLNSSRTPTCGWNRSTWSGLKFISTIGFTIPY